MEFGAWCKFHFEPVLTFWWCSINKSDNHVEEIHINLKNSDKNFTKNSSEVPRQSII